jgi:sirohydrochlorin ferrochelatase
VTTQSPHLYARQAASGTRTPAARRAEGVQTRLPWWAVVLPALAFAALLALISAGSADASTAAPAGDVLSRAVTALPDLLRHVL